MNLEQFKKEKIQAMKEHDQVKVAALNTVISKLMLVTIEARAQGKELTDADVVKVLQKCEKELIEEVGRLEVPGRPRLYGTTEKFLRIFGLSSIEELPPIKTSTGETI